MANNLPTLFEDSDLSGLTESPSGGQPGKHASGVLFVGAGFVAPWLGLTGGRLLREGAIPDNSSAILTVQQKSTAQYPYAIIDIDHWATGGGDQGGSIIRFTNNGETKGAIICEGLDSPGLEDEYITIVASGATSKIRHRIGSTDILVIDASGAYVNGTAVSVVGHTHAFSSITGRPTTLSGYGITDGITATAAAAAYQPLDSDLTSIAALTTTSYGRGLLTVVQTDALTLPSGTTAQRPASPTAGMLRWNSDLGRHEFRTASAWVSHVRLDGDTMTGQLIASAGVRPATDSSVTCGTNGQRWIKVYAAQEFSFGDAATNPMLRGTGTTLEARRGDGSDYTQIEAAGFRAIRGGNGAQFRIAGGANEIAQLTGFTGSLTSMQVGLSAYVETTSAGVMNFVSSGGTNRANIDASGVTTFNGVTRIRPNAGGVNDHVTVQFVSSPAVELNLGDAGGRNFSVVSNQAISSVSGSTADGRPWVGNENGQLGLGGGTNCRFNYNGVLSFVRGGECARFSNAGNLLLNTQTDNGARLQVNGNSTFSGIASLGAFTVATLPSPSANPRAEANVTDSSVTTFGSNVAGGGSSNVKVRSNGTNWTVCGT